jgi:hypothetical protein
MLVYFVLEDGEDTRVAARLITDQVSDRKTDRTVQFADHHLRFGR